MPEDLVCKFTRCISVGSWQDPWRINGPARMKGRERRRGESFLPLESLSFICGEQCLFSLFQSFALVAPTPDPSVFPFVLSLFLSTFSFTSFSLIPRFLPRSASVQPSNKRTDRVYSREPLDRKKKRKNRSVSAVHPRSSLTLSLILLCSRHLESRDVFRGMFRCYRCLH